MSSAGQLAQGGNWSQVRPRFLAGCAAVLCILILPDAMQRIHAQRPVLLLGSLAIVLGWFLLKPRESILTKRDVIALAASLYVTLFTPVLFLILFLHQPWRHSALVVLRYAPSWHDWSLVLACLCVAGSFLGRGRSRIAFVVGSTLLLVLQLSM